MLSATELLDLQKSQHVHDMRNHFDILSLHKTERLKHYGLHFAKYVGRLARGANDPKPFERTMADTLLVILSAANTLHQNLSRENFPAKYRKREDLFRSYAEAAGRFADACEKIDHMEEFVPMALQANRDILLLTLCAADEKNIDLCSIVRDRRKELASRHFYIES